MAIAGSGVAAWSVKDPQVVSNNQEVAAGLDPSQGSVRGPTADASVIPGPVVVPAPQVPGSPRRLQIPALDVDASVQPVEAPNRTLVPPPDPQELGWWAGGARPGELQGSVLVAGHTVHTGGGALDELEELEAGDRISMTTTEGNVSYEVRTVSIYDKGSLASSAERVFSQEVPGRLVVVTCEDWDGSRYLSNVVVVAAPVP